jgi:peptide/nickel transport system ATP-binding protein
VDASLRAMILDVMMRLRDEINISFLYITHDLSTAYQIGDDIYVLYQGAVAERGKTSNVIEEPSHPYVQLLINSIPVPDPAVRWGDMMEIPSEEEARKLSYKGCRFFARCPNRMDRCLEAQPPLFQIRERQEAACYLYENHKETVTENA